MQLLQGIRERAKKRSRKIALPEAEDERVLKAARDASDLGLAEIFLVGNEEKIKKAAAAGSVKLDGIEVVDPERSAGLKKYAEKFYELRRHKGVTEEQAKKILTGSPMFYAGLMVRFGEADGFVAGAVETSANVARAAIYCIGINASAGILSSAFVVEIDNCGYGQEGAFVIADSAIVPDPSPRQLAGIAYSSANLFKFLLEKEPVVAMLSYSTKGSASGPLVDKVVEATKIAKELYPGLMLDGELQLDSAVDMGVAGKKCPDSPVAGKANVLIFPDLNSGNIGYKIIDRLANGRTIGPILQGVSKPCSDLSRGCKYEDIVDAIAITTVREQ